MINKTGWIYLISTLKNIMNYVHFDYPLDSDIGRYVKDIAKSHKITKYEYSCNYVNVDESAKIILNM